MESSAFFSGVIEAGGDLWHVTNDIRPFALVIVVGIVTVLVVWLVRFVLARMD